MIIENSPSSHLVGKTFDGVKAGRSWLVKEKVTRPKGGTGGAFSVGYIASDSTGEDFFLKATDIGLLRVDGDKSKLDQMADALNLQRFEREMLDICTVSGMNRIVRAVDYGELEVIHEGVREFVFFIVFEKAIGDIRASARDYRKTGISWIPRVVHNMAVATSQLHRKNISHNDIKPSNLLVFDVALQKLSDLGRATCADHVGPWDRLKEAGDRTYSAPEAWGYLYATPLSGARVEHSYRKRFDLYMLGSLIYFLLTEQSLNTVMAVYLRPEYGPSNWTGDFAGIMPYLRDVHGHAMADMDAEVLGTYGKEGYDRLSEILQAVRYLTDVNPESRGDPRNNTSGLQKHDLQRLISRTDILSKKIALLEKT
tara:strand:+ start:4858 stop:5964 length:1107 start_codon:yes stop_codon:yes gene_type:complete